MPAVRAVGSAAAVADKILEVVAQLLQGKFQVEEPVEELFVRGVGAFAIYGALVGLDGLLDIVDVDQLDIELVVEVFDLLKLVLG